MRSSDQILASRYARALFETAVAGGAEGRVGGELGLAREAAAHPELGVALKTPRVGTADKKKLLRAVLAGKASPETLRFLDLLLERKRLDLLGMMTLSYDKLLDRKRGVARAEVRAARKPSDADLAAIRARLERFVGLKVDCAVREDPELIAGVVVKLGDWVLDASLRGELDRLKKQF